MILRTTDFKKLLSADRLMRRDVSKVPRSDRHLHRMDQRILADALLTTEDEGVIDLFPRALHSMRRPIDDVRRIVGVHLFQVVKPSLGLRGVA